jgi:hypothetical protein
MPSFQKIDHNALLQICGRRSKNEWQTIFVPTKQRAIGPIFVPHKHQTGLPQPYRSFANRARAAPASAGPVIVAPDVFFSEHIVDA